MCAGKTCAKPNAEPRKIRKPLMEKKRRARINDCLEELKKMLLKNKKEGILDGRPSKLEKADILEQTVDLLRRLSEPKDYLQGFRDSQSQMQKLIASYENLRQPDKQRLSGYLFAEPDTSITSVSSSVKRLKEENNKEVWRPW